MKNKKIKKSVIFMGYSCNNKCVFCCNENKRNIKEKSFDQIKKILIKLKKEGYTYLELIGGEPTIRKDFLKIIRLAKKLSFETIMFATNGRMLSNYDFAKKVIDAGVNHIVFSIHGHTKELHNQLTQSPKSFEQLIKGITNLKKLGFTNIGSNTTIVKQNCDYLKRIGELIYNLGIKNAEFIFVDPTHGAPNHNFETLVPNYEDCSSQINKLLEFATNNNLNYFNIRYYPLCFIDKKYHDKISEINEVEVFDVSHLAPDYNNIDALKSRKIVSRKKIEKCNNCDYFNICEGYWVEYIKNKKIK
ncbi:radical SAM protein [Candidatus Woesearchaeota archaeon]|nr:radical SAM protein [Candidatus Woesearchaeota archaeon]